MIVLLDFPSKIEYRGMIGSFRNASDDIDRAYILVYNIDYISHFSDFTSEMKPLRSVGNKIAYRASGG